MQRRLLRWYAAARRELPWRADRDPYRVWISEAMLQQTRVEAVVPYYERFLARFPDVQALAAASEEQLLAAWSGLGYYSRARRLGAAARAIVERHDGRFPATRSEALALPGVGPYTAGAVLSIAYDLPEPLVDGNVARVLCRWYERDGDPTSEPLRGELWELATSLVPADGGAGDWNQALMELGATVCTPRSPRCAECPLRAGCGALVAGRVDELPQPRARREPVDVELALHVVRRRERILLARRPEGGRMAGLLELPTVELAADGRAAGLLFPTALPRRGSGGPALERGLELGELRHSITHHRIRARVFAARPRFRGALAAHEWRAFEGLAQLELTGLTRKALRAGLVESATPAG